VKLASLDSLFQLTGNHQNYTFVDLCGGPGGFAEYLIWRAKENNVKCRGWGITLRGVQDYDLFSIKKIQDAIFTVTYGADGTGDLYLEENNLEFTKSILKENNGPVNLVVADGGFSVKGDEEHQEEHSKQILVAQILAMFRVLKQGGHFCMKIFDTLTDFSVEAIYILYLHFEKISIVKPLSSRPGNSERYIVCLNLQESCPNALIEYLVKVNLELNNLKPNASAATSSHNAHQPGYMTKQEKIDLGLLGNPNPNP
jgi:23S rRNA U2552 (ribose-2'-O)-methylase RlmE/FtsJ